MPDHPHPIAEDRPSGERAGGIDRDDTDQVSAGPPARDHLVAEGALAAPRRSGHPDHASQPGTFANLTEEIGDAWIAVLHHPDRTCQRAGIAGHQTFCELRFGHRWKSTGGPSSSRPHRNPVVSRVRYKASGETTTGFGASPAREAQPGSAGIPRSARLRAVRCHRGDRVLHAGDRHRLRGHGAHDRPGPRHPQAVGNRLGSATASATAAPTQAVEAAPGRPFTVLLLGSDNDAKFGGTVLTQSMILAQGQPHHQAGRHGIDPPRPVGPALERRQREDRRRLPSWWRERRGGDGRGGLPHPYRPLRLDRAARPRQPDQPGRRHRRGRHQSGHGRLLPRRPVRQGPLCV